MRHKVLLLLLSATTALLAEWSSLSDAAVVQANAGVSGWQHSDGGGRDRRSSQGVSRRDADSQFPALCKYCTCYGEDRSLWSAECHGNIAQHEANLQTTRCIDPTGSFLPVYGSCESRPLFGQKLGFDVGSIGAPPQVQDNIPAAVPSVPGNIPAVSYATAVAPRSTSPTPTPTSTTESEAKTDPKTEPATDAATTAATTSTLKLATHHATVVFATATVPRPTAMHVTVDASKSPIVTLGATAFPTTTSGGARSPCRGASTIAHKLLFLFLCTVVGLCLI